MVVLWGPHNLCCDSKYCGVYSTCKLLVDEEAKKRGEVFGRKNILTTSEGLPPIIYVLAKNKIRNLISGG